MKWHRLDDRETILRIMNRLVSNKGDIHIRIRGGKAPFFSRVLKVDETNLLLENSEIGVENQLIIDKLSPEKGNSLIQSFPHVTMEFSLGKNFCRCSVQNIGVSNIPPHIGFIMSFPEALEIEEKREEERVVYEMPEMVSVQFKLTSPGEKDKAYTLHVIDRSRRGFGLLVTQKDFDLLGKVKPGDRLEDMTLYSESLMMRMDGIVRHKTKIEAGRHRGSYIMGIELRENPKT